MSIDVRATTGGRWLAQVSYRKIKYYLGSYGSEEAARAVAIVENERLKNGTSVFFDPVYTHTYEAFADEIGVARGTVKRWAAEGMPKKELINGIVRVDPVEAGEWVAANHAGSIAFRRRASVYVVERMNDRAVKIGWTSDVERRMQELRKDTHQDVSLIGCAPADKPLELAMHAHFADRRIDGEWFAVSATDAFAELVRRVA